MKKHNGFKKEYQGLQHHEVIKNQEKYGLNELIKVKKPTFLQKVLNIFKEPMFVLLIVTSLIYFILGEPKDGIIMLVFVFLMITINVIQEWRTDKALQALKELSSPRIKVIRNGEIMIVDSVELTMNDLMILEEGDRVPADGIILENKSLSIDESTLTGESAVVWKTEKEIQTKEKWKLNYCYAGTSVTYGSAIVKVTGIGYNTEYGKIGAMLATVTEESTPLNNQIKKLVKFGGIFAFIIFFLVMLFTFLNSNGTQFDRKLIDSILSGITVAMSMIPEEFPVILTIFLAMGSYRLAKNNALMRKMPATETLGAVTVLCVDKTGTLTENRMKIKEIDREVDEAEMFKYMELACEEEPYDPMEKAIKNYVKEKNMAFNFTDYKIIYDYPFLQSNKMMGHVWQKGEEVLFAVKGSFEKVISLSTLSEKEKNELTRRHDEMAQRGLRILAVAKGTVTNDIPLDIMDNTLTFLGMIGFEDPARKGVKEAVTICKEAGIRIIMITGDNGMTAGSIAKQIGLDQNQHIISGEDIEKLSDEQLEKKVKEVTIFARVIPEHKLRIIKALKRTGEVVGMTGDGVNDAPALKSADIGIAMGGRGTNVAKEVADMVIVDDNFTTIVHTIKDGRRIYDNIKKSISYVLVMHIIIAILTLLPAIFGYPLLLLPVHIVFLEMIIDPTCSIVFERQEAEKDIMKRKPRNKNESLVNDKLLSKSLFQGFIIGLITLSSYIYLLNTQNIELARSFALMILIVSSLLLVYENQSIYDTVIMTLAKKKDKIILLINTIILTLLLFVIYIPLGNQLARTKPLNLQYLFVAVLLASISVLWWDIVKLINRNKH